MKNWNMVIFLAIVLTIYGLLNYYIFIRGWQAIPRDSVLRTYYLILFIFIALTFFTGRLLENRVPVFVSDILIWIGSFWWGAILYFLLIIVMLDIIRLINRLLPFYPSIIADNYASAKQVIAAIAIVVVIITVVAGYFNARNVRIKTLTISVPKDAGAWRSLNIVAASDIHLGTIIGRGMLDQIVAKINALNPDIVLLPGDIIDEDPIPVMRQNLGESLKQIKAPLGVYAVTGNHEYYGGVQAACEYLEAHGIKMLRDTTIKIADSFYLVGRDDREKARITGQRRKSLEELLSDVDKSYPIIVLDHQPYALQKVAESGIDLQISGHTHYGQLWPLGYITNLIYELSWGYKLIGSTHFYVSSGAGTWGPPMRLGNVPEIVNYRISFR
jgi:predicted MPP superfamily phosphohydrolase